MRTLALGTLVVLGACGPSGRNEDTVDARVNNGDGAVVLPASRVFAHSGSKLYQIDTTTLAPVEIGTLTGIGTQSLTDIAIDKGDRMIGVTLDKLYAVDATTGAATLIKAMTEDGFTSLSFVPSDLNNANSTDILVSANFEGSVVSIDTTTGVTNVIGSYGSVTAGKVGSSGDLIGVHGLGIYATVNVGTEPLDYLARIDPVTWKATPIGTGTGYDDIFGLAYWEGKIYGFVAGDTGAGTGKIITIDQNSGVGTEVLAGSIRWYGAGVATDAPILQ